MLRTFRRLLACLLLVALVATACRADGSLELTEDFQSRLDALAATPEQGEETVPAPEPTEVPASETTTGSGEPDEPEQADEEDDVENAEPTETVEPGDRPADFAPPREWDEELELDTEITVGELPNGLRYLIQNNGAPGSQAQLRLVVEAGSVNEAAGAEGSAHFLEHMMFNGTTRFPDNEMIPVLESFGASFGADVNAYTTYEETVYLLEVPARDAETLQLGLDVLREWASEATIEQDAVVAERGVVREEARRFTENVSGRLGNAIREVLFAETDFLGHNPIGTNDVIENMDADVLREFYEKWYRPELMTVIAVGDFTPSLMEERIIETFSNLEAATEPEDFVFDRGSGPLPEPVYDVVIDPEIQRSEVEMLWRTGTEPAVTAAGVREIAVAEIASSMLNSRLFEELQGDSGLLLTANANTSPLTPEHRLFTMVAGADPGDLGEAAERLLTAIEQARQHGFSQAEVDRAVSDLQARVDQALDEGDTRQDVTIADELVEYALRGVPVMSPQEGHRITTDVLASLTSADAQRYLFDVLETDPYVLVTGPAADAELLPSLDSMVEVYEGTIGRSVPPRDSTEGDLIELMARPEQAEIINEAYFNGIDTTVVTYANGARLAYRRSTITENFVQMRGVSPGGFFAADGPEVPLLSSTPRLVAGSGFESVDVVTLDRLLSGALVSVGTEIGRAEEVVWGEAASSDIELMFQTAHLLMTEPTITDLQVRQFDEGVRPLASDPGATPRLAADLELWRLRYGDSPWFRLLPTVEDLDALDPELQLQAYKERFSNAGDFTFLVVGDFNAAELVSLGASYLGTLPDDGRRDETIDRDPGVPEENLVATVNAGLGDQGRVRINWESPYDFSLRGDVTADVLELVVNARLRDLLREELGASYAPDAALTVLSEPKPWIDTIIEVESDPERVGEVSEVIQSELDRIRAGELDAQYVELAIAQVSEQYRFFSNNDWLDLMHLYTANPDRDSTEFRSRSDVAESLTLDDIVAAAQVTFPEQRSVEVRLVPADG